VGAKAELERELIFCKARIEALEEQLKGALAEKAGLFQQIEKLQDSLISVTAPDAYRDQQLEKEEPRPPMSAERQKKNRITKEFTERYLNDMEKPMFQSGDDLDDLITTGIIRYTDTTPKSIHGNDES
jgi:4-diphosphocytidyl-2C-methyl-D-erythritol kinase